MNITFLEANRPLTKTYTMVKNEIVKTPYPLTWEFTSHTESFTTLPQLEALLKEHAALGHCALKGMIQRPLQKESRAGSTDASDTTQWLVLDIDGLDCSLERALDDLNLSDVNYIVQWSASYGIEDQKLRAHVFMLLDKPYTAPTLKEWLKSLNFNTPLLTGSLSLVSHGNTLHWPLDISACQNDKLIYIAPPVLKGIKDPMNGKPRIKLVKGKRSTVSLPAVSPARNEALKQEHIARLRKDNGLPARKFVTKFKGETEYLVKPDKALITEMKQERGFVYFNLNGGNSWAYYHPENNPDFIYNFKGEPTYLTKELLPEYWAQIANTGASQRTTSDGLLYLAFCDRASGVYWRGTYDQGANDLNINVAKNESQLRSFCKENGVPLDDFIPEWDLIFDPNNDMRVDVKNRTVNIFQSTPYMLNVGKAPKTMPPTAKKIISHALNDSGAIFNHFVNWLASIVQTRGKMRTAWVLHGTEGTGKGLLLNNILRPLFGAHVSSIGMASMSEPYNSYLEKALFVFADEVQTSTLRNEGVILAKLRNNITEPFVEIRRMYAPPVETRNYSNWILASNMPDPVKVKDDDRRYNIGEYQSNKLIITDAELVKLERQLQPLYNYLANYPTDVELAGTVLETKARADLVDIGRTSLDTTSAAVREGNFEFFMDMLPSDDSYKRNALEVSKTSDYISTLKVILSRTDPVTGRCNVTRDELKVLFNYCIGGLSEREKFISVLKHYRIRMECVWIVPQPPQTGTPHSARGFKVQWQNVASFPKHLARLNSGSTIPSLPNPTKPPKLKLVKSKAPKTRAKAKSGTA